MAAGAARRGRGARRGAEGRRGGRGGPALAAAGLLALLLGGAQGQGQYDYDYEDYAGDGAGFSPAPRTPVVLPVGTPAFTPAATPGERDPTEYVPIAERPGQENPTPSDLLNAVAELGDYFRQSFGLQREESRPITRLSSFLDRATSTAEQTRTGLESVMSGVSTVTGSLERIQQEWDLLLRRRPASPGRTLP